VKIGELAQKSGLRASAIRYYERLGLIPAPQRTSGQREYGPDAMSHLAIVQFALVSGFTLHETQQLVRGVAEPSPPGPRWKTLAAKKTLEMDALIARATLMKDLLRRIQQCSCGTLAECGRRLERRRASWAPAIERVAASVTARARTRSAGIPSRPRVRGTRG